MNENAWLGWYWEHVLEDVGETESRNEIIVDGVLEYLIQIARISLNRQIRFHLYESNIKSC